MILNGQRPLIRACLRGAFFFAAHMITWSVLAEPGTIAAARAAGSATEPEPVQARVDRFVVNTGHARDLNVPFYVRRPARFKPGQDGGRVYRLLFICPVMNRDGLAVVTGDGYLLKLADERDWFVLAPSFDQSGASSRDRARSYYYPETYSGRAVVVALDKVAERYPVDPHRILLHGLSGGAQFVHRLALWVPERVTAVAVNSSSWFDTPPAAPGSGVEAVAWLLTVGDADPASLKTWEFADRLREAGALPVLRSYLGMVHEGGGEKVDRLVRAFLTEYDERTRAEVGKPPAGGRPARPDPAAFPCLGDAADWTWRPNSAEAARAIPEANRVYLPSPAVAQAWGIPAEKPAAAGGKSP